MTPEPIDTPSSSSFQFPSESEMAGLPDGEYRAQVATCELRTSQAGNIMWSLKLEIIEPPSYLGRFVFDNITFSHAAAGMVYGKLKALGMAVQAGQPFNPSGSAHRDLIGRKVLIVTKAEEYNGQVRAKVSSMKVDPGPGGLRAPNPSTASAPRSASGGSAPQASAPTTVAQRSNPTEKPSADELPF